MLGGREKYLLPQPAGSAAALDLTKAGAVWIDRDTVAWNAPAAAASVQLLASREGAVTAADGILHEAAQWLRLNRSELSAAQKQKFPHLASYAAYTIDPRDRDRVRGALRGQLVASARAANGAVLAATGVQLAGVLDDLYATTTPSAPSSRTAAPPCRCGRPPPSRSPSNSTAGPSRCTATTPPGSGRCAASGAGPASATGTPSPSGPRPSARWSATSSPTRTPPR